MQDAESTAVDRRRVLARRDSPASRLDADELYARVVQEPGEEPDGIGPAADARDRLVGETPELLKALAARLASDYGLEVLHHLRIRIGAGSRPDHVESVVAVRDPVAESFVHRVLQCRAALLDCVDCRAEHLHALDIRRLALHVYRAHIDLAGHSEKRGDRRRSDAVHPRAGLGDETLLAHSLS